MRKSIAIDMDETIADTLTRHITCYQEQFNTTIDRQQLVGKRLHQVVPISHVDAVKEMPNHPAFFEDLAVFDHAVDTIKILQQDYDIYFVSAAMEHPSSFNAKYAWLKRHFSFVSDMNYIFCGYKGMLNCDYLIDDSARHLDVFQGQGYLFSAPHNQTLTNYKRINNWQEALMLFR